MISSKSFLFLIISIITVSGCRDSSSDPANEGAVTVLEGTWAGECADFSSGNFTGKTQWLEHYSGSDYQAFFTVHDSTECSGSYAAQKEMLGTFSIGDSMMTNSGVTANNIDLFIDQGSADVQIAGIDISAYGFSAGQMSYDIFYLDGNAIYYGDYNTGDGSSEGNRPTDIDFTLSFVKQ